MYILAKYRTRLLEFMKKGMTRLEELNRMVGTNRPMNAVASAGLWGAFILVAACIMLPLGVAFHLLEVENLFPHPLTALSLIMIVLYLIPSLLWWIHRGLFKSTRFIPYDPIAPEKVIALDKTTPPIRERYMLFIVGSIIRVSLIVQTAIHSRPFYQVLYEVEGAYPLLYCFPYIGIYSFSSFGLVYLIYHRMDISRIKKLIRLSLMMYGFMLPAVYVISMMINYTILPDLLYKLDGVVITLIGVAMHAVLYFSLILIWYAAKKMGSKK